MEIKKTKDSLLYVTNEKVPFKMSLGLLILSLPTFYSERGGSLWFSEWSLVLVLQNGRHVNRASIQLLHLRASLPLRCWRIKP